MSKKKIHKNEFLIHMQDKNKMTKKYNFNIYIRNSENFNLLHNRKLKCYFKK